MKPQIAIICPSCYEKIKDNIKTKRLKLPGETKEQKCSMCGNKRYNIVCQLGGEDED